MAARRLVDDSLLTPLGRHAYVAMWRQVAAVTLTLTLTLAMWRQVAAVWRQATHRRRRASPRAHASTNHRHPQSLILSTPRGGRTRHDLHHHARVISLRAVFRVWSRKAAGARRGVHATDSHDGEMHATVNRQIGKMHATDSEPNPHLNPDPKAGHVRGERANPDSNPDRTRDREHVRESRWASSTFGRLLLGARLLMRSQPPAPSARILPQR